MTANWIRDFKNIFPNINMNVDMKNHTHFKIGGFADVLAMPRSYQELINMFSWCKENEIPKTIIGNGSNLLVSDKGIRGIVIKIGKNFSEVSVVDNKIKSQAGALLSHVAKIALENRLSGFEFASGIPGSIGGAVYMNAGAYKGEMKHVVSQVKVVNKNGEIEEWDSKRLSLSYRSSAVAKENALILEVETEFEKKDYQSILKKMKLLNSLRTKKQPLDMPSAGSVFKRPQELAGSYLIDKIGLKGYQVGGAQVSTKHAGFIVNTGNATAQDVLDLMAFIQKRVYKEENILLQPEVRFIGEAQDNGLIENI